MSPQYPWVSASSGLSATPSLHLTASNTTKLPGRPLWFLHSPSEQLIASFPHAASERIYFKAQSHLLFYPPDADKDQSPQGHLPTSMKGRNGRKNVAPNRTMKLPFRNCLYVILVLTHLHSISVKYLNQAVYGNKYQNKSFLKHRNQCKWNFCKQTYHGASSHCNSWRENTKLFQALLNFLSFIKYPSFSLPIQPQSLKILFAEFSFS